LNPVLLYDGECGLCAEGVQRVLRHDRHGTVRFAPLQGTFASGVRARHPEIGAVDSMIWIEPGDGVERLFVKSAAGLRIARHLGGLWRIFLVAYAIPNSWRDIIYDFVARHRHQLVGTRERCLVPSPELRGRFLD